MLADDLTHYRIDL